MLGIYLLVLVGVAAGFAVYDDATDDDDNSGSSGEGTEESNNEIRGTGSDDDLTGTDERDTLFGFGGDDSLSGKAGDDTLNGGDGQDDLFGDQGDDTLSGGNGEDLAIGGTGDDTLRGGQNQDVLFGGEGDDDLKGDTGRDLLFGASGNDELSGGFGSDVLVGNAGEDTLLGGDGDDVLYGGDGGDGLTTIDQNNIADIRGEQSHLLNAALSSSDQFIGADNDADILDGGDGADLLFLGAGDTGTGGAGADEFVILQNTSGEVAEITDYDSQDDALVFYYPRGGDEPDIEVSEDSDGNATILQDGEVIVRLAGVAIADVQIAVMESTSNQPGITDQRIFGDDESDQLAGGAGFDEIAGQGGDDLIEGNAGNDRLFGQDGDDILFGGSGDDFLRGGAGVDILIDGSGEDEFKGDGGDDVIISTTAVDEAALVENIKSLGDGFNPDDIDLDAIIDFTTDTDSEGDIVDAGVGDDLVIAGSGDTVSLGDGADTLVLGTWAEGTGAVTVTDFVEAEDALIYSYHPLDAIPVMSLQTQVDPDGGPDDDALLFANGNLVAVIKGQAAGFGLDDVAVTARS